MTSPTTCGRYRAMVATPRGSAKRFRVRFIAWCALACTVEAADPDEAYAEAERLWQARAGDRLTMEDQGIMNVQITPSQDTG